MKPDPTEAVFDETETIEGNLGFEKNLFIQIRACMEYLSVGRPEAWNAVNALCDSMIYYQDEDFKNEMTKIDADLESQMNQTEQGVRHHQTRLTLRLNAASKKFKKIMSLLGEKGVLLKKTDVVRI